MASPDPEFFRVINGYTIQRNQPPATDPGDPRYWWWKITNPSTLPGQLQGYWPDLTDLETAIRLGKKYK